MLSPNIYQTHHKLKLSISANPSIRACKMYLFIFKDIFYMMQPIIMQDNLCTRSINLKEQKMKKKNHYQRNQIVINKFSLVTG